MKIKKIVTTLTIAMLLGSIYSQEEKKEFKPSGQSFVKVFTNFHSNFTDGNVYNAFQIQRAYFGYAFKLSEKISGKVNLDFGDPGVGKLQMTAYLKNAYFQYKTGKLTTKFGLIGMSSFALQEKQWGNRYLYKSFQDEYGYGPSADLGVFASYKFNDMFSADATISNGDGYKSIEKDSVLKYSAGFTVSPLSGLNVRVYYDIMGSTSPQQTMSFYAGYSIDKIKVGAEYNQQLNHQIIDNQKFNGFSVFGSYQLEKARIFGRFDNLSSVKIGNASNPWNYGKDGQLIIAGVEFSPTKGLKITPNYQAWMPESVSSVVNGAYLSCEIKF